MATSRGGAAQTSAHVNKPRFLVEYDFSKDKSIPVRDADWSKSDNTYEFAVDSKYDDSQILEHCIEVATRKCKNKSQASECKLVKFRQLRVKQYNEKYDQTESAYQQELEYNGTTYELSPCTVSIDRRKSGIALVFSSIVSPYATVIMPSPDWWKSATIVRTLKDWKTDKPEEQTVTFIKYESDAEGVMRSHYVDAEGVRHTKNDC